MVCGYYQYLEATRSNNLARIRRAYVVMKIMECELT